MTDNEIIKALKYCKRSVGAILCTSNCPMYRECASEDPMEDICGLALDLINRQKAEIEKLNKDCEDVIYKLEYLLCNATGNKFSKYTYPIGDMVSYVNDYIQDCCNEAVEEAKEAVKSEAIKEFAKQVKMAFYYEFDELIPSIMADKIDNLVEEMTEVQE